MPTVVEICNLALTRIGNEGITSLEDDSKEGRACNRLYEVTRDILLSSHSWVFARHRESLEQLSEGPDFGYEYYYQLPSDCLRPLEVVAITEPEWVRESDRLLTNATEIDLLYVRREENPVRFDPFFVKALYLQLGGEVAWILEQKRQLKIDLLDEADFFISEAKRLDAIQGNPDVAFEDTSWQKEGR